MNLRTAAPLVACAVMAVGAVGSAPAAAKSPLEPGSKPPRQCFWNHEVENFASNDDRIVNVRVRVKDIYQFEMFGRCDEVDWANHIAIVSRGSDYICTGMDADIVTPSSLGPHRCAVRSIRKLTPEEVAALPKHARP
jgi:hypothetical protein